ncbi:Cap15 family cyclic dinucleotide receptor domain-containing protein, partial [Micromonospora aurantiaca (nom. illeg.)]
MALTYLPTFLIIGVVAFDLWVWKWPGVARISNHPRIGGTWRARLQPHPDSHIPENGNRGPIEAAMIIEQTYWTLAIRLLTSESASISTSATLRPEGDSKEQRILAFTYRNAPKYEYRPRSQPHGGAVNLAITGCLLY